MHKCAQLTVACRLHAQKRMERLGFGPYSGGHTMPSGFEGLVFMMQICGELHLYGFDPQTDKDVKYHYFDEITVTSRRGSIYRRVG